MDISELKLRIIQAGEVAVEELIKIAEEPILGENGTMILDGAEIPLNSEELSADKLKNAAATKKLAIFDAFEILARIKAERDILEEKEPEAVKSFRGFAERRKKN